MFPHPYRSALPSHAPLPESASGQPPPTRGLPNPDPYRLRLTKLGV